MEKVYVEVKPTLIWHVTDGVQRGSLGLMCDEERRLTQVVHQGGTARSVWVSCALEFSSCFNTGKKKQERSSDRLARQLDLGAGRGEDG